MKPALLLGIAIVLEFSLTRTARAEWQLDGNPITAVTSGPYISSMISDGSGGCIVAWADFRTTSYDIYVQRFSDAGAALWTANGVALCAAIGDQESPTLVSDGVGGAIATWEDSRTGTRDVYARRITSAGAPQWTADGVALCTATNGQFLPQITSDGANGAIVVWRDLRSGTNYDIYARRVSAAGTALWTANGVAVCTAANGQTSPELIPDGLGGAFITWDDSRSGPSDIYAQRLNSAGTTLWLLNGVALCAAADSQLRPRIATDGAGGAIIAWWDLRTGLDYDIYARRIDAAGVPQWNVNGNEVCVGNGNQDGPLIVSDGVDGIILAWADRRSSPQHDVYTQRMTGAGAAIWTANGVPVCTASGTQIGVSLVSDGASGAVIAWQDDRFGTYDIYARRILASGLPIWTPDGSALSSAAGDQEFPIPVPDGVGGATVGWSDGRSVRQIYAQRAEPRYGTWGRPEPTIVSATDNPSDEGGYVITRWIASEHDRFYYPAISHYSVWRTTDAFAMEIAASSSIVTNPADVGENFDGVAIWEVPTPAGPLYWEWVANQPAFYSQSYSYLTPTRQDSIAGTPASQYFKVIAHEQSFPQSRAWESGSVTGYSLDNLAPAPPRDLTGSPTPWDITLTWTSGGTFADFDHYAIYRASISMITPSPQYLIGTSDEILFVDANVPSGPLYYIVTAIDIHGNQSGASNVWSPSGTTPVGDTPSIQALTVLDNAPNPFNARTTLRIGLPGVSDVEIEVFDVAGRHVRSDRATLAAGWRTLSFDARDERGNLLPSGVYFYRVKAVGETVTRKMVIAR